MVLAFAALILILAVLAGIVAAEHGDTVVASFSATSREVDGIGAGLSVALATGGLIPLLLFCGRGLRTRGEAGVAAICAGFCGIVRGRRLPPVLHVAVSADHRRRVADVSLDRRGGASHRPQRVRGRAVLADDSDGRRGACGECSRPWPRCRSVAACDSRPAWGRGAISASAVAIALVLTSIGLIDLIVQRNSLLFVAFLLVFWLPLLTRGLSMILQSASRSPRPLWKLRHKARDDDRADRASPPGLLPQP